MNQFENILEFRGTWRLYQKRVLNNFDQHATDKKIHIVAAPGSGKTTVGIEMIKRLGQNCLILTPSITIREQWLARVEDVFLCNKNDAKDYLSNTLSSYKPITAITYQAMHSIYAKETSEENIKDIEIVNLLNEHNVKVICLDEAHHMRNEWVKALEQIISKLEDVQLISLTATPPYDANFNEWKRYIDLCGPIDEEIFTPELVKEESLCPHQDYVYFNWPTKEERAAIEKHNKQVLLAKEELMNSPALFELVKTHPALTNPQDCLDSLLENPAYLYALILYMEEKKIVYPSMLSQALSVKKRKLPTVSIKYLEILMQGILFHDLSSFNANDNKVETLRAILKKYGCIYRNEVRMLTNENINKSLINSKGKLESIKKIALAEYHNLGEQLRMLILCDFIKKESLELIGSGTMNQSIGTVPVFEALRTQNTQMKLSILSGSIIVLPKTTAVSICKALIDMGYEAHMIQLNVDEYVRINSNADNGVLVKCVTDAFEQGEIQILIGTKALLGEGWDSPCINSLILASFVGSYVSSNQMRGRAIRKDSMHPDKVSNIWHLVCIEPKSSIHDIFYDPYTSYDLQMLKRRFATFLGVHYTKPLIESGFTRLSYIQEYGKDLNKNTITKINNQMLDASTKREELRDRWNEALVCISEQNPVEDVLELEVEMLKKNYVFANHWLFIVCTIISSFVMQFVRGVSLKLEQNVFGVIGLFVIFVFLIFVLDIGLSKLLAYITPQHTVKKVGQVILATLEDLNIVSHESKYVRIKDVKGTGVMLVYLEGGNAKDKHLFSTCMEEYFSSIDNQRYIIVRKGFKNALNKYFAVPEIFAKRKQDAQIFTSHIKRVLGLCELVYTRNAEGRKMLLKARGKCFGFRNEKMVDSKRKVLGKYE
ncbi:helicase-like protein [Breznakia blatticola]|uniref:Helicase-like protein n=1 Tax=Breznakia blatticola TaxID=1754012 RepID=A0A4R8A2E1_9FIRM|nr:DEAD/DEAH box helicase family protein [Breznakia blatticola]TDW24717.1 helicase-like protein [Breznakia blatticola]